MLEERPEDLNLSPPLVDDKDIGSQSFLSNLKPLCFNNLVEDLGGIKNDKVSALDSSFKLDQKEALRDLGFVSPSKALSGVRKGYFLRSVSKSIIDGLGLGCVPIEVHQSVKGRFGVLVKSNQCMQDGSEALRVLYASSKLP